MIIDDKQAKSLGINTSRLAYLDGFLAKAVEDDIHPTIVIRAARKGVEFFNGAYGVASPGGPPVSLDMITEIQSVTKSFTATGIMILQEDGLLDIKQPLQDFYPDFQGEYKEETSIWQLMSHVSGLDDELMSGQASLYYRRVLGSRMPKEMNTQAAWDEATENVRMALGLDNDAFESLVYDIYLDAPLKSRPGTQFNYCNRAYSILMRIIEKLAGESMDSFAQKRIFQPLRMVDSHYILPEDKWPRVLLRDANCNMSEWGNSDESKTTYSGSGGLKSTVADLLRFCLAFQNMGELDGTQILSPQSVRMMTRNYNQGVPKSIWHGRWYQSDWALGWNVRNGKYDTLGSLRSDDVYDHAGYGGARLFIDPGQELVAAYYMVDRLNDEYPLHAKTANILYSALRD